MHIRVSEAELRRDNQESVALTEGGGFLGWMGVFHGLHCVVRPLFFLSFCVSIENSSRKEYLLIIMRGRICCGSGITRSTTMPG